jgi:hypothetical protein
MPEQNDLPLPVTTAALILSFAETSSSASYRPARSALLIEFLSLRPVKGYKGDMIPNVKKNSLFHWPLPLIARNGFRPGVFFTRRNSAGAVTIVRTRENACH